MTSVGLHTKMSNSVLGSLQTGAPTAACPSEAGRRTQDSLLLTSGRSVDHDFMPHAHAHPVLCWPLHTQVHSPFEASRRSQTILRLT